MKRPRTSGERIKALRDSRGETQEQFAFQLGVKRAAVSAWEKDDKLRGPSSAVYLKLSALEKDPDRSKWFLRQADIDERVIFSVAEKIGLGKSLPPVASEVVRVPALDVPGSEDIGELLLPNSLVPNPNFARYFVADDYATQLVLAPGIVVIDTSDSGNRIRPFLGKVVLVHLFSVATEYRSPLLCQNFLLGKVWPTNFPHGAEAAVLAGAEPPKPVEGVYLGHEHGRAHGLSLDLFVTSGGIRIEGRIIAWFAHEDMQATHGS